ncbi:MAG: DsbA family protein [Acidimicrobiales bacterium]
MTDAQPTTIKRFSVTWDYRCPFARNAHEHLLDALDDGAPYDVTFVPFSLNQMHLEEGDPAVFDDPTRHRDLLAMLVGIVVRDRRPDRWRTVHRALFALRHDDSRDLRDESELRAALEREGVDAEYVFGEIASGWPLDTFRKEHDAAERDHAVWGVPTFIVGDQAAFVRIMTRPKGDGAVARRAIDRILDTLEDFPELNELKHTSIKN